MLLPLFRIDYKDTLVCNIYYYETIFIKLTSGKYFTKCPWCNGYHRRKWTR